MLLIANLINPRQHMVDQMYFFFTFCFLLVVLGEESKREREKIQYWTNDRI